MPPRVTTVLLAGGKGTRLSPLTDDDAKPAIPFGGVYRIIDFTLSNCINSHLNRVLPPERVLTKLLRSLVREDNRKLEACATWGKPPACRFPSSGNFSHG